ncbi:MAG TPA: RNA polymerase sigma factor, partial [Candidatus Hydrogenedentes bacterium]|nr:RNA polymerase sigma factor [Candidatus Hydrogenedentota bacterium]HOR50661.1 RNA polymerase sigma factor [Candidatus Hydrogenedentota bacterium]HPK24557.1 RNA polymerase sigma factor [Candidatus Hydrogenedentota bacterium]
MEVSTECSDEQLMALLCEGNTNALALLVERYQNDIFRFCIHYLRDLEAARDAAQDIFLKVFAAKDKFDTSRSFRPWLLRIARNLCFNLLKRAQIVPMESLDAMQ